MSKIINDADYFIMNPQTNLLNYYSWAVEIYARCVSGLSELDIESFFNKFQLEYKVEAESIISNLKGKIYYFQQLGDDMHVDSHLYPFLKPILKSNFEEFSSFISSKPSQFLNESYFSKQSFYCH